MVFFLLASNWIPVNWWLQILCSGGFVTLAKSYFWDMLYYIVIFFNVFQLSTVTTAPAGTEAGLPSFLREISVILRLVLISKGSRGNLYCAAELYLLLWVRISGRIHYYCLLITIPSQGTDHFCESVVHCIFLTFRSSDLYHHLHNYYAIIMHYCSIILYHYSEDLKLKTEY